VILNVIDQFSANNNFGFNLTNFRPDYMRDFYESITKDYERSFIGTFVKELITKEMDSYPHLDLYFSISKFEKNLGYSLSQNDQLAVQ
jgi:hypothetical protein